MNYCFTLSLANSCNKGALKRTQKTLFLAALLLLSSFFSGAIPLNAQVRNYSIQANIIYHFTKYIDWPPSKKTGDFIIGVTGDSPLYDALVENISHKLVNGRRIIIKKINSSSITFDCHILFVSEDESRNIRRIAKQTENTSTLIVSEEEGLAKKGSCINFTIAGDHLKLEINKKNIETRKLDIATELLQLGTLVS